MIIYTCPECGGDLDEIVLTSNPPIYKKRCPMCGWEESKMGEVIRIPYQQSQNLFIPPACRNCSNHPSNGGSGICNCTLGGNAVYC